MTTVLRGSSPGTGCRAPTSGALMNVVISGLVKSSQMPGVHNGSKVSIQFLAEPQGLIRDIVGQGVVYDGISPYKICPEDFDVKFSTGVKGRFIPPKEPKEKLPTEPVSKDGAFFDVTFKRWSLPFQGASHDGKGRDSLKA